MIQSVRYLKSGPHPHSNKSTYLPSGVELLPWIIFTIYTPPCHAGAASCVPPPAVLPLLRPATLNRVSSQETGGEILQRWSTADNSFAPFMRVNHLLQKSKYRRRSANANITNYQGGHSAYKIEDTGKVKCTNVIHSISNIRSTLALGVPNY